MVIHCFSYKLTCTKNLLEQVNLFQKSKSCALVDMYIADWNDACFAESIKPKNEQNSKVYQGSF